MHRIEDGAHEWDIDDPSALETSAWLRSARPVFREFFENAVKRSTYPMSLHFRRVVVTTHPSAGEFTPRQAAPFVGKPLYVLVENRFTDGHLLHAALTILGTSSLFELLTHLIHRIAGIR